MGFHNIPSVGVETASGSYVGNDTVNKAIAHGLGVTPKIVFISGTSFSELYRIFGALGWITGRVDGTQTGLAVTIPNNVNFYVGNAANYINSANASPRTYLWVAIG